MQLKSVKSEPLNTNSRLREIAQKLSDKIKIKVAENTGSTSFRSRGRVAGTKASSAFSRATALLLMLEHNKRIDYLEMVSKR